MTPKTKTDPAVELERLEEVAAKARQEAGELAERARTQQAQRQQLDVGLAQLAREDPSQFGDDGLPMPGSDAAKLKTSLEKLGQSRLSGVAEGAQERVRPAEEAVARRVEAHADLLARKENEGPGKAAVGKIQRGLAMAQEGVAEYDAVAARLIAIVSPG